MMEFKNNYHTHTFRCGHASDFSDEEYVVSAINNGFEVLGFSDHIMLPGISQPRIRGDYSLLDDYVNSINTLKEKYKNTIKRGKIPPLINLCQKPTYFFAKKLQKLLTFTKITP